ncbi:MAG: Gfo/Idh/MocA family oxidoreductase [Candidatus Latescibacteria bacterium]|nr:Gfo/Idh/MocA family oxidoreductase [Candidatus Latescibacterota bacterium]
MVSIGIAGMGFMGVTHFRAIEKIKGARVVAICTRDQMKLRGDWRKVQGNFGGSGGMQDVSMLGCHPDLNELLADPEVDLVDLCLPTSMHVEWSVKTLEAGKHLLLEKPIALDLQGADRILAAARRNKRLFMVAQVLRYFPEFRLVRELVEKGAYGPVLAAHFKRIISRPAWWDAEDLERTGGPAIDLHIHDADFVQYLFGMPGQVTSSGYVGKGGAVEHLHTHYHFPGMAISAEGGWLSQQGCPFEHGYDVYFEKATLKYNSSWGQPPLLLTSDGKKKYPKLPVKDGFVGEIQEAVDAVRQGKESKVLSGQSARNSLLLCLREIQSIRSGKRVKV